MPQFPTLWGKEAKLFSYLPVPMHHQLKAASGELRNQHLWLALCLDQEPGLRQSHRSLQYDTLHTYWNGEDLGHLGRAQKHLRQPSCPNCSQALRYHYTGMRSFNMKKASHSKRALVPADQKCHNLLTNVSAHLHLASAARGRVKSIAHAFAHRRCYFVELVSYA